MEEGIVLLKNEDGALPLDSDTKNLNVFGWGSIEPFYGGTGSGAVDAASCITLLQGLADGGYTTNSELTDFYTNYHVGRPLSSWDGISDWTLSEPSADSYPQELIDNAKAFSDTALIVIGRTGGENCDLPTDMSTASYNTTDPGQGHEGDFEPGDHYLQLTGTEEDLVDLVCANFDNVIIVLNSANAMEMGWVEDYEQITGVLWCPGPGETGFNALGSVLNGSVNPSGHLPDTFVYDLTQIPAFNNFGNNVYSNSAEFLNAGQEATFVNYVEGIYVGYKFYETAAVEGLIDFDSVVQYPFGYGLPYPTENPFVK